MKRLHVFISGKVQGIFFRQNVKEKADSLKITGFIRNLQDGRVEALFEGEESSLKEMLAFCKAGIKFANVENIQIKQEKIKKEFKEFWILR